MSVISGIYNKKRKGVMHWQCKKVLHCQPIKIMHPQSQTKNFKLFIWHGRIIYMLVHKVIKMNDGNKREKRE